MRLFIHLFFLLNVSVCMNAQTKQSVQTFHPADVRLLESPFLKAQELDKQYLLALDADRLLHPFLREAGLPPKKESYTNWENSGLDGHIGGHYISALSIMYASTGDKQVRDRLDYMIAELKRCQDANCDGYIGGVPGGRDMWKEIASGDIRAGGFSLNEKWVPLYNIHKTFAGLRDAWLYAENKDAKEMLIRMADWAINLTARLSEQQMQDMLRSEHGGLNEVFADVAHITGELGYMELAHRFCHKFLLEPLLRREDNLTGLHANTQIPKVLGFKKIADLEGCDEWAEAARFFWETVIENRSVSIGGNSTGEHFNATDDYSRMIKSIEGPETCNTYNMLRLTKMLYETSGDKKYIEYYERALYNHILSTQHPDTGGFVYFTQIRPGHYRVYSQPQTSMWCCVGSGIENHAKYGEMIYARTADELFVNLFIPSRLKWNEKKTEIVQENNFPDEAATTLTILPEKKTAFTLQIRYPDWIGSDRLAITVNGEEIPASEGRNGYISIDRVWENGDEVRVELPMHLRAEQLPDRSNYYSFLYGPIVLAAKTGTEDLKGLFADDSRGGHIAHGRQIPLKDMPILVNHPDKITDNVKPDEGKPLTFRITGLYPEDKWSELELIPFFRLHESRYILYWPQATKEGVVVLQNEIEKQEKERIRLDNATLDKVVCGEQQPESDHFIQFEQSNTGFIEDTHWREAKGWFSYRMQNKGGSARYLYVSYFDRDRNRQTAIYVNSSLVKSVDSPGNDQETPVSLVIPLPDSEKNEELLTVRFSANGNASTAKIVEVRLLSQPF